MKDYRFYVEMIAERGSKSGSKKWPAFTRAQLQADAEVGIRHNCIAVPLEDGKPLYQGSTLRFDTYAAINDCSNASVVSASADRGYLRARCVRIDEALARRLHPKLFTYLEQDHA